MSKMQEALEFYSQRAHYREARLPTGEPYTSVLDDGGRKAREALSDFSSQAWEIALCASNEACYRWPDNTAEHRALRAAFVDGAHAAALDKKGK